MRKIDRLLDEYGQSHRDETNKAIHWICVPLIFFSIIGLLWSIPSDYFRNIFPSPFAEFVNWGTIGLLIALGYYLSVSFPLFVGMLLFSGVLVGVNYALDQNLQTPLWVISLIVFVLAWVGQFWGHKIEGKKPSFLKDVQFLLIGPAWLMHFIYKKLGVNY